MYEDLVAYKELLDSGALSQEEFDKIKASILGIEVPSKSTVVSQRQKQLQRSENVKAIDPPAPEKTAMEDFNAKKADKELQENSDKTAVEEIMEYKALLDSGAITQSEFNRKKSQILGVESDEDRALREASEAARMERERLLAEQEAEIAKEKAKRDAEIEAETRKARKKAKSTAFLFFKCACAFVFITVLGFGVGLISGSATFTTITVLVSLLLSLIAITALVITHKRNVEHEERSNAL